MEDMEALTSFITTVTAPMKDTLTIANLGTIIAAGLGIAIVFVLGWTAYRWIYHKVKSGFKKGK